MARKTIEDLDDNEKLDYFDVTESDIKKYIRDNKIIPVKWKKDQYRGVYPVTHGEILKTAVIPLYLKNAFHNHCISYWRMPTKIVLLILMLEELRNRAGYNVGLNRNTFGLNKMIKRIVKGRKQHGLRTIVKHSPESTLIKKTA